jgi:two-component system sensor histidine kinase PrrB
VRLSTRFAVCVAVLVPLLVSLAGLIVLSVASHDMRAERDRQLTVRLRALTTTAAVYARRARPLSRIPPDIAAQRLTGAALGADSPGGVYVEVPGAEPLIIGDVPAALPAAAMKGPATFVDGTRRWRYVMAGLGARNTPARLWVFEPEQRLAGQLALLRRRLLLVTLAAVGAGAAAGFGLGRFAVRPLAVLRRQARAIDRPPLAGARLATSSGVTEIDELAVLLNHLLDRRDAAVARTGEALESARAFAATAAHELRTPLTSMGTNLSLLDHPDLDPAERAEILADLSSEHGRIQRLITMLRQLARGELLDPATFADVDLTEVVATAVEESRRRHPHAAITSRLWNDLVVRGSAEGLRVIVDNLIDNAATHGVDADGHAVISVLLTVADGAAVLAVQDAGRGIDRADRESVFARFHRRAGSPGSGLGLTLVRQQAMRHGGAAVVADLRDGAGTRIEVRLPVAGPAVPHPGEVTSWLAAPDHRGVLTRGLRDP